MAEEMSRSQQMLALTNELNKETERGQALLVGAYLENLLGDLITTALVIDSNEVKSLDLFDGPVAPLGTFSARMRVAYSLGLLTKDEYDDIKLIKDIRNAFAHQLTGLSFTHEKIASRCQKLKAAKVDGQPSSMQECFNKASIRLMVDLILRIQARQRPGST